MRSWRSLPGMFAALLALAGCGIIRPSEELRYRLTVEVDTPEGLRTGSSVIAVRGVKNPDWVNPEGRGTRSSFRGEAVAVDLPGGRTLFALLRSAGDGSDAADYPWLAFRDRLRDSPDWLESIRRLRGWKGETQPMPETEKTLAYGGREIAALPLLATFRNVRDPASAERIGKHGMDEAFGEGTRLRQITVTLTDEPVTTGIDTRLPWLTRKTVMDNPGWRKLPYDARFIITNLFSDTIKKRR